MDKQKLLCITMTFICLAFIGCHKRDAAVEEETELKASDVAQALGMNWWFVQLPADLDPNDFVGVTYKHPDGSIERPGGSNNWQAGSTAKVMVWPNEDSTLLRYAVFNATHTLIGSLRKKTTMTGPCMPLSNGEKLNAGDVLMKFGEQSVVASPEVLPGEIGLILHVKKSD